MWLFVNVVVLPINLLKPPLSSLPYNRHHTSNSKGIMKITRTTTHYIIPAAAFAVCTAGILVGSASAASATPKAQQRRQQNEARYEQRLETAVTNGKLTSAQEQLVLTEHNTLKAQLQGADTADRAQVRTQVRQEANTWAQQNNIAVRWLGGGMRFHHRKR